MAYDAPYGPMRGKYASGDYRQLAVCASGEIKICSGLHVTADIAESGIGVQVQSGVHVMISGQHVYVESGVHVIADVEVAVSSGLWVVTSGQGVQVQSGLEIIWRGVQVSGTVAISGSMTSDISGQFVKPVIASGLVAVLSGEIHVMSGSVTVQSGLEIIWRGVQVSGTVAISGNITIATPTVITVNPTTNPKKISSDSGGDILDSGAIRSLLLRAPIFNSGDIYVGGYTAGQMPYSGAGLIVAPGEAVVIDTLNIGYVRCFATVSGYIYANYLGVN